MESDNNIKHYSYRWFILFQIKHHDFEIILAICHRWQKLLRKKLLILKNPEDKLKFMAFRQCYVLSAWKVTTILNITVTDGLYYSKSNNMILKSLCQFVIDDKSFREKKWLV
jgi:hypothetical protein